MARTYDALLRQPIFFSVLGGCVFVGIELLEGKSTLVHVTLLVIGITFGLVNLAFGLLPWWLFELGVMRKREETWPKILGLNVVYGLILGFGVGSLLDWLSPTLAQCLLQIGRGTVPTPITFCLPAVAICLANSVALISIAAFLKRIVERRGQDLKMIAEETSFEGADRKLDEDREQNDVC
jgi:hypothetical protein